MDLLLISAADLFLMDDDDLLLLLSQIRKKIIFLTLLIKQHSMLPKIPNTEKWIINYNNLQFFQLFRLEKSSFEELEIIIAREDSNKIFQKEYSRGHHSIPLRLQLLIFLWYMGTQDTLISIGSQFNMSRTTVMHIVNRLLYFIVKLKTKYIKFPESEDDIKNNTKGFQKYPGVVGAIDGTHIFLTVSADQQDSYIDRYRRHSINLMVICNANRLLLYIFVGFPGSAHDSRVFENSLLFKKIERYGANNVFINVKRYHLIGDSAFQCKAWLMTPYRDNGNLSRSQKHHNYILSSERVVVEHTIGCIKGRWRRLQFIHTYHICKSIEIVTAACVLHNFTILRNDIWKEILPCSKWNVACTIADIPAGREKRDEIKEYLYRNN